MKTIIPLIFLLILSQVAAASGSTYDAVVKGKKCQEDSNQNLSCSYKVGKTLYIEIAGIGSPDTGIAFLKSDFKGDYYGKYGILHGCIIVANANAMFDMAFISPMNGKVYKSWQECKRGM